MGEEIPLDDLSDDLEEDGEGGPFPVEDAWREQTTLIEELKNENILFCDQNKRESCNQIQFYRSRSFSVRDTCKCAINLLWKTIGRQSALPLLH